jgi:hypothetical protein
MIGFAPFGDDDPPQRVRKRVLPAKTERFANERTECNYIVIFFVVGVLALAMGDAVKR